MKELVMWNAELGIQMTKVSYNGQDMILADNVKDVLKWDTMQHMLQCLEAGKDYVKMSVNTLKSDGCDLALNLVLNRNKKGRPVSYVHLITEQGMWRLIATRRPHDVKDDPALAEWLDKVQDWVFGEVLPAVAHTGAYMTDSTIEHIKDDPNYVYVLADALLKEKQRRELAESNAAKYKRERGLISSSREASAMSQVRALKQELKKKDEENGNLIVQVNLTKDNSDRLMSWLKNMKEGRWGKRDDGTAFLF